ncbi:ImmA/IrrE family metallo-endopeptidase [Staphylococcus gallinarum]|uniref:ImmA/IrrE family metallo-endopeptidase n=1 Tax=Staphylococcus gallinarum TaxID=1293 RepID=UPI0030C1D0D0
MNYEENQAFMRAVEMAHQVTDVEDYPVPIKKIIRDTPNIRLMTFSQIAKWSGTPLKQVPMIGRSDDAFLFRQGRNKYVIAYNSHMPHRRIRFSLAHEYGHYLMNHSGESVYDDATKKQKYTHEEFEADVFASCLLFPLHKRLEYKGKSSYEIANAFDISFTAVRLSMKIIEKHLKSGLCEHLSMYAHRRRESYINYLRELCN